MYYMFQLIEPDIPQVSYTLGKKTIVNYQNLFQGKFKRFHGISISTSPAMFSQTIR